MKGSPQNWAIYLASLIMLLVTVVSTAGYAKAPNDSEEMRLAKSVTDDPIRQLAVYWKIRALQAEADAKWNKTRLDKAIVQVREAQDTLSERRRKTAILIGVTAIICLVTGAAVVIGGGWALGQTQK